MDFEQDYKKTGSSGSGTEIAYSVEAMHNYIKPIELAGQIFDNRWRRVEFAESSVGVPRCADYQEQTIKNGLLGYSAAQAINTNNPTGECWHCFEPIGYERRWCSKSCCEAWSMDN